MKFYLMLCIGLSLFAGSHLAADPVKKGCHCTDCSCTPEAHCGCFSEAGCSGAGCNCSNKPVVDGQSSQRDQSR